MKNWKEFILQMKWYVYLIESAICVSRGNLRKI